MKKKNIFQLFLSGVICLLCTTSCSVEPDFYSQVVPETFYSSQDAVWQRFNRPFTHWRWYIAHDSPRWLLQELGTDEFCLPSVVATGMTGPSIRNSIIMSIRKT